MMGNSTSLEAPAQSKELVIECIGCNDHGCSGCVEITDATTLSDVRTLIMVEFDEEMIPDKGNFYFCVDGVRLGSKQEPSRSARVLQKNNSRVSIHSKRKKQRIQEETEEENVEEEQNLLGQMIVDEEETAVGSDNEQEEAVGLIAAVADVDPPPQFGDTEQGLSLAAVLRHEPSFVRYRPTQDNEYDSIGHDGDKNFYPFFQEQGRTWWVAPAKKDKDPTKECGTCLRCIRATTKARCTFHELIG